MSCQCYRHRQQYNQKTNCTLIGLIVSGLESMTIMTPDNTPVADVSNLSMILIPPGFRVDFSFNARRENYAALCRLDALSWDPASRKIELTLDEQKLAVPPVILLSPDRLEPIREQFRRAGNLTASGFPMDSKIAELVLTSILAEFAVNSPRSQTDIHPLAEQLKKAIDADIGFSLSLSGIMADLHRTETHLRRLFVRYYHTHPAEYRARLRFNRIVELLSDPSLSLKEIADIVGMKHVTHLHLFVRKRCGLTPVQLRTSLHN